MKIFNQFFLMLTILLVSHIVDAQSKIWDLTSSNPRTNSSYTINKEIDTLKIKVNSLKVITFSLGIEQPFTFSTSDDLNIIVEIDSIHTPDTSIFIDRGNQLNLKMSITQSTEDFHWRIIIQSPTRDSKLTGRSAQCLFPVYDALKLADGLHSKDILAKYGIKPTRINRLLYIHFPNYSRSENYSSQKTGQMAVSTLPGGLNVTKYADGIAKFLVDRTKQELSIAFFDKFKQELEKYPDLGTLFPQTVSTLQLIDQEIYMYKRYLTTLREEFNNDLNALPDNFPDIVENHPEFFEKLPGLDALLTEMSGFVADIRDEVHPGTALEELDPLGFAQIDTNLTASFQTIQLFSYALRDTSTGDNAKYWAPKSIVNKLISNEKAFDIFLGLLYEQARQKKILFAKGDSLHVLIDLLGTKKSQYTTKYKEIKHLVRDISTHADRLNKQIKKQVGSEEKMSLADVLSYFDNIMDILEASSRLPKALPFKLGDRFDLTQVERVVDIGKNMSQMVAHVADQKYAAGIANAVHLYAVLFDESLNENLVEYQEYFISDADYMRSLETMKSQLKNINVTKEKKEEFEKVYISGSKAILTRQDPVLSNLAVTFKDQLGIIDKYLEHEKNSPTKKALLKYGTFIANVAEAEDSDAVASAIDQFALPVGSWRIKRQASVNVSLQAYLGIGCYWNTSEKDETKMSEDSLSGFTLSAPLGISVSTSFWKNRSASLFFSLIDVGAIASFRFDDNETEIADVFLKEIISPGVFLSVSPFPKLPFVINGGYQRAAKLKDVDADKNILIEHRGRWSVSVLVDIPIANFYNKSR